MLVIAFTNLVAPKGTVEPCKSAISNAMVRPTGVFFSSLGSRSIYCWYMKRAAHDNAPLWMPVILTSSIWLAMLWLPLQQLAKAAGIISLPSWHFLFLVEKYFFCFCFCFFFWRCAKWFGDVFPHNYTKWNDDTDALFTSGICYPRGYNVKWCNSEFMVCIPQVYATQEVTEWNGDTVSL